MAYVQIRNISPPVHRALKRRAARAGMSLSEYLRLEIERIVGRPEQDELIALIRRRARAGADLGDEAAAVVRRTRDAG